MSYPEKSKYIPQKTDLVLLTLPKRTAKLPYERNVALVLDKRKNYWNGLTQYTLLLGTKTIIKSIDNDDYLIYVLNRIVHSV